VTRFEETVLEALPNGKIFMFGHTEIGQMYKTYSDDQEISWKHPVPTGLASSCTHSTLIRIPKNHPNLRPLPETRSDNLTVASRCQPLCRQRAQRTFSRTSHPISWLPGAAAMAPFTPDVQSTANHRLCILTSYPGQVFFLYQQQLLP
jgi:hypothetical protein